MHYLIMKWNKESLKWEVVFYANNYKNYTAMKDKYADSEFVHMIDIKSIESYQMFQVR